MYTLPHSALLPYSCPGAWGQFQWSGGGEAYTGGRPHKRWEAGSFLTVFLFIFCNVDHSWVQFDEMATRVELEASQTILFYEFYVFFEYVGRVIYIYIYIYVQGSL